MSSIHTSICKAGSLILPQRRVKPLPSVDQCKVPAHTIPLAIAPKGPLPI